MRTIFAIYSRQDLKRASALTRALEPGGVRVVRDEDVLSPGDLWPKRLGKLIADSGTVLLLWSRNAAQSQQVEREWNIALGRAARIVIVLFDDEPLPAALSAIDAVTADRVDAILKGLDATPGGLPPARGRSRRAVRVIAGIAGVLALAVGLAIVIPTRSKRPDKRNAALSPAAAAPALALAGFVQNDRGDPLQDVRIVLPELNLETATDSLGRFSFPAVSKAAGQTRLIARKTCFQTWTADAPTGDSAFSFVLRRAPCDSR